MSPRTRSARGAALTTHRVERLLNSAFFAVRAAAVRRPAGQLRVLKLAQRWCRSTEAAIEGLLIEIEDGADDLDALLREYDMHRR